ncbi:uncharacterized protein YrzB (UPF0473 family) [Weissella uvarum]|uniref:DUF1292 domain-containing protein n=1 Tax=Weissella uvarum TaxID=1479233 RepID=UPI00195FD5C9|nr:DUF1292 domain-containing protein [Weissella uvarum]MBM7618130.1 uncharacterized protein YrzB (UPF0473 family) [Weissella uvarum]MCM0595128.1 DUF1292 domain-containing protein [Weissella uvarum]
MDDEQDVIALTNENGDEELFEVLFTFHSDEYNKDYLIVYPAGADFDQPVDMYPFVYHPEEAEKSTEGVVDQVEDEDELAMVEAKLNEFIDDLEEAESDKK